MVLSFARGDDDGGSRPHPITGLLSCLVRPAPADAAPGSFAASTQRQTLQSRSAQLVISGMGRHPERAEQLAAEERLLGPWRAVTSMLQGLRGQFDAPPHDGDAPAGAGDQHSPGMGLPATAAQVAEWWSSDDEGFLDGGSGLGALLATNPRVGEIRDSASGGGDGSARRARVELRLTVGGVRFLQELTIGRIRQSLMSGSAADVSAVSSTGRADERAVLTFVGRSWQSWYPRGALPRSSHAAGSAGSGTVPPPIDAVVEPEPGRGLALPLWPCVFWLMRAGCWDRASALLTHFAASQPASRRAAPASLATAVAAVGRASQYAATAPTSAEARAVTAAADMEAAARSDASAAAGRRPNPFCPFRLAVLHLLGLQSPEWGLEAGGDDDDDDAYGSGETAEAYDPFERYSDDVWRILVLAASRRLAARSDHRSELVAAGDLRMMAASVIPDLQEWRSDDDDDGDDASSAGGGSAESIDDHSYTFATNLILLHRFEWAVAALALHGGRQNPVSHAEDAVHIGAALYSAGLLRTAPAELTQAADAAASGPPAAGRGLARYACGGLLVRASRRGARPASDPRALAESLGESAACHGDVDTTDHLCVRRLLLAHLSLRLRVPVDADADPAEPWAGAAAASHPAAAEAVAAARAAAAYATCLRLPGDLRSAKSVLASVLASSDLAADALAGDLRRSAGTTSAAPTSSLLALTASALGVSSSSSSSSSTSAGPAGRDGSTFLPSRPPFLVESGMAGPLGGWPTTERALLDAAALCRRHGRTARAVDLLARAGAVGPAVALLLDALPNALRPGEPHRSALRSRAELLVATVHAPGPSAAGPRDAALRSAMTAWRDAYGATFDDCRASLRTVLRVMDVADACVRERYADAAAAAFERGHHDTPLLPAVRRGPSGALAADSWEAFETAHPLARGVFSYLLVWTALCLQKLAAEPGSRERMQSIRMLTSHPDLALPPGEAAKIASMLG